MNLKKNLRILVVLLIVMQFFLSVNVLYAVEDDSRPRRVRVSDDEITENRNNETNDNEQRTGVRVTRKRRHGVVRRGAEATANGVGTGAKHAAKGTATGAKVAARNTAKGAKIAGKSTALAGKKVAGAFK
jgi:hypothetical protein